jgi:predicted dehydrogenase
MPTDRGHKLRWGVLGTGRIARNFAAGLAECATGTLAAVGSRDAHRGAAFAGEHGCASYSSYAELVADRSVDAVYIALPNHLHADWTIHAADAGKHILCEKPFALNADEAERALAACRANDVFCMEAFMYRCHPQMQQVAGLISQGTIGEVRLVEAAFGANVIGRRADIRDVREFGGGAVLDLGSYCTSMAIALAAAPYVDMQAEGHLDASGVDTRGVAQAKFANGVVAVLLCARDTALGSWVSVHGTAGSLRVVEPWIPSAAARIELVDAAGSRVIECGIEQSIYTLEADAVAASLDDREAPAMTWEDTIANARMLDDWRACLWREKEANGDGLR